MRKQKEGEKNIFNRFIFPNKVIQYCGIYFYLVV